MTTRRKAPIPTRNLGDPAQRAGILRALERDYMLHIEAYCNGPNCTVREVAITVKDYDKEFAAHLTAQKWLHCPVCQSPLTVHAERTRSEQTAHEDRQARMSVNTQIAERDSARTPGGLDGLVDVHDILNDALPPTAGTKPEKT